MDQATKAALFSALLFPGWGQFYLKRYKRGLAFLIPVMAGCFALIWLIVHVAAAIIKASPFVKGTIQFVSVLQVAFDAIKSIDLFYFLLVLLMMAVIWILSIIDAYQLGKRIMAESATDVRPESASDQV